MDRAISHIDRVQLSSGHVPGNNRHQVTTGTDEGHRAYSLSEIRAQDDNLYRFVRLQVKANSQTEANPLLLKDTDM